MDLELRWLMILEGQRGKAEMLAGALPLSIFLAFRFNLSSAMELI
jgi:hypothetical protein